MVKAKQNKLFILDTNIVLHDPTALFTFAPHEVGIPATVIEELDRFKAEGTDRGRNAREFARMIDEIRQRGSLREGIELDNGSLLRILFMQEDVTGRMPFKLSVEDNMILLTAVTAKQQGYTVTFVSKDLNARIKADALGIEAIDYQKEYVSEQEFYKGWIEVDMPAVELKKDSPESLIDIAKEHGLAPNQFVVARSAHNPHNYRLYRYMPTGRFKPVTEPKISWPLSARNVQQLMALELLFDDSVQLVSLIGPAGTGKTFITLLAGLHKVLVEDEYEKMLISRPVVPLGRDVGYLPGTLEEKLQSWMQPVYDNMSLILHEVNVANHLKKVELEHKGKKGRKGATEKKPRSAIGSIDQLVREGKLSLEAITYMRGRSIPYQFILIDEVQNLTPHEVKTLISRVGHGSKLILSGDPYQIDSPYLDFSSNGLIIANERFKGQDLFGSVYLETSERSQLSQLVNQLM